MKEMLYRLNIDFISRDDWIYCCFEWLDIVLLVMKCNVTLVPMNFDNTLATVIP